MKISTETLQILKNYVSVNRFFLFREGNIISTISSGRDMFSRASVAETFPKEVAIYELNNLLGLLTMMDEPEVEFGDHSLVITKDSNQIEYFYADPMVLNPPLEKWSTKTPPTDGFYTFTLTAPEIQTINKAASIVAATKFRIVGKDGKVQLQVLDPKTAGTNNFKKHLGDFEGDNFMAQIPFENFKVIVDSYDITINKKRILYMKSNSRDLGYWFSLDKDSEV